MAYDDGSGEDVYDVHTDHLDTPRVLTDDTGAIAWRASYEAYGEASLDAGNSVTFNVRFPGQYFDAETGMHYNWHRYYAPELGRYVSADPIGQWDHPNVYQYAFGNPGLYVDPLGLAQRRYPFTSGTGGGGMNSMGGGGSRPGGSGGGGYPAGARAEVGSPNMTPAHAPGAFNPRVGGSGGLPGRPPGGAVGAGALVAGWLAHLLSPLATPPPPGLVVPDPLPDPLPCDPAIASCEMAPTCANP